MSTKQRRNDMCNCGSKQKFKKCCLVHKQKPATVYHGHVAEQDKKYTFKSKNTSNRPVCLWHDIEKYFNNKLRQEND